MTEARPDRCIAAFDFDGTVSKRDTLIPFLVKAAGRRLFARECARLGLVGAQRQVDLRDRDQLKEQLLGALFRGRNAEELRQLGTLYARDLLSDQLRPDVLARLREHRQAGHEVLFVSASLVYYLEPLAELLGLSAVLAVEPAEQDGRLTGGLVRPNVRAEQKALRLREWLEAPPVGHIDGVRIWGYGNSSGDHELLAMSDEAYWLGRPAKAPHGVAVFSPEALRP